jgi:tetratricopeptide (TPR) repeat protein
MPHADEALTARLLAQLRERSDDAQFFQDLAKEFHKQKLYQHEKAAYELSLELDPLDRFTHLYLGNWYYRERKYGPALEHFERARDLMPDDSTAFWCMAGVFERREQLDEAEALYRKAIALDPTNEAAKKYYRQFRRRWREA